MDGTGIKFNTDTVDHSWKTYGRRGILMILIPAPTVPQNTLDFRNASLEMLERLTHHAN